MRVAEGVAVKRSAFKPKIPPRRPVKTIDYTPRPRAVAVAVHDGKDRMVVSIPKEVKARPGKPAPTVAESAWMDAITTLGCIACYLDGHPGTPGAVHHLLRGGQRIGHLFTICLCDPGHHQQGQAVGLISRHPWKARFESKYGTEASLLTLSQSLVAQRATLGVYA